MTRPAGGGASRRGSAGWCRAGRPRAGRSREHSSSLDVERLEHAFEDQRAGQHDVGPVGVEPGEAAALLRRWARRSAPCTRRRTSSAVSRKRLNERGGSPPDRGLGHARPPPGWCPTSRRPPRSRARPPRGCTATASSARTPGSDDTAPGCSRCPGKKRLVRRTAPSLKLRAVSTSPRSPIRISVEPPPMSHRSSRRSNTGTACSTPRWMSRASSTPEMTSTSMPACVPRPP